MDPIKSLGTKLDANGREKRDAVHMAILPATIRLAPGEYVSSGDRVDIVPGTTDQVQPVVRYTGGIGIVDPFLQIDDHLLHDGDRVWVFLYPNTIQGLRHHWYHPKVDDPTARTESELWLLEFARRWGFDYDRMLKTAIRPHREEDGWPDYIIAQGKDLHNKSELGEDYDLFWEHLSRITGQEYSDEHKSNVGWSCSC